MTEIIEEKEIELCGIKYRAVMLKMKTWKGNIMYTPRIMINRNGKEKNKIIEAHIKGETQR
jgi:hypothetical protein